MRPELTMIVTIDKRTSVEVAYGHLLDRRAERRTLDRSPSGHCAQPNNGSGTAYLSRGYITIDEYEDLQKYLCLPVFVFLAVTEWPRRS